MQEQVFWEELLVDFLEIAQLEVIQLEDLETDPSFLDLETDPSFLDSVDLVDKLELVVSQDNMDLVASQDNMESVVSQVKLELEVYQPLVDADTGAELHKDKLIVAKEAIKHKALLDLNQDNAHQLDLYAHQQEALDPQALAPTMAHALVSISAALTLVSNNTHAKPHSD